MANSGQYLGSGVSPVVPVTKEYPVANGVTVYDGDFVYLTSGRVTNASIAGKTLLGMVFGANSQDPSSTSTTGATTGDAAGTQKVLVVVEPNAKFYLQNNNVGATFAASMVGQTFSLTGNGGAQLVDTNTAGTTGQLECIAYRYNNDATMGVYVINLHKYKVNG